ncbi:MAG TPA: hypothetical protein VKV95_23610 [Terriglobia bacterium]|nr:hypothetical protein [Terriglobia bacterium]
MKTASVRDLRYRFPEVEARLRHGEEIQITKRRRVIARLVPVKHPRKRKSPPDFMAILKRIYGTKMSKTTGADLVSEMRGRY